MPFYTTGVSHQGLRNVFKKLLDDVGVSAVDYKTYIGLLAQVAKDGKLTLDDKDALTELAVALFDEFVVPYDVPLLPSGIEEWVEGAIRAIIPTLVRRMLTEIS